jgi:hypothetical protein
MASPHSLDPHFTPGARLSRLPVRTGDESLEDFYRDLFAGAGPAPDRQRLLRLLDEDGADGAKSKDREEAMDHLGQAFRRIDAWTHNGDCLPSADRAELKRRAAHNLLAVRPGLPLVAQNDTPDGPDRALLRQVQAEHAAWRQGWAIGPAGPGDAPYGRRPWAEPSGPRQPWDERPDARQPRQPWDEQAPRPGQGPADALRRLGRGEPLDLAAGPDRAAPRQQDDRKTYWYVTPKPTACDKCLAMAGKLYPAEPERPHPNCKCEILSRKLTAPQAPALQDELAVQARDLHAEHERIEREKQAAQVKANCPAYVDDSRWRQDGDPVKISGQNTEGNSEQGEFPGHALPRKTPGGVSITYGKATADGPTADRRVTRQMRDTVQEVLDDPRVKAAGVKSVNISCTTNGAHAEGSAHYDGRAVDISRINGDRLDRPTDPATPQRIKVLQEVLAEKQREGEIEENFGPQSQRERRGNTIYHVDGLAESHANHIHVTVPKETE